MPALTAGIILLLMALLAAPAAAAAVADEGPDIHLWGLVENTRLEEGKHRTAALFLYHRTSNPDGSTYSSHYLNYVTGPGFSAVLPLWYRIGEDRMLVPLWFQGPGYGVAPLALSGGWKRDDGGDSLWITPLFHRDRDADGRITDLHLLNWLQGDGYRHLLPLWFSGREWWSAPLALSGGWRRADGGRSDWITPLFHASHDRDGRLDSLHLLNWYQSGDQRGLLPLWTGGPNGWTVPIALSGTWKNDAGGRTTWVTPLFHRSTDAAGRTTSLHALTWFHQPDADLVLPLYYRDAEHTALLPLWFSGRNWWVAPPALSGGWRTADGGREFWVTPLFRSRQSGDGRSSDLHALPWLAGRRSDGSSYQALLPLYYRRTDADGATRTAVLPLWFGGPDYDVVPAALSGRWRNDAGGSTTWVTPLFHRSTRADGSVSSLHAGPWLQDNQQTADGESSRQVLFPLWWRAERTRDGVSEVHNALLPLWLNTPDSLVIPPLLSAWWRRADGGSTTWATPFFHLQRDRDGTISSLHALTWYQSGDDRMLLPFFYRTGPPQARSYGVIPLWFANPEGWTVPPALSWHRRRSDGSDTTWITPLVHVSHDADGSVGSMHALNWFQGRDWQVLFPLAYRSGQPGQRTQGIIPLVFTGPGYWAAPLALSGSWSRADGGTSTWITPLAHLDRNADGSVDSLHALNWFQGRDWQMLFPLAYRSGPPGQRHQGILPFIFGGPGYWVAPPALSGSWTRQDGGSTTWITPLFHLGRDRDGTVDGMHVLNWLSGRDYDALLPIAWRYGEPGNRHVGVVPLWFSGPGWSVCPPLLSARWRRADGGQETWITPLFHQGRDASGSVTDWHAVNVIHSGDTDIFAPLAWSSGPAGARRRVVLPLWFSGPGWWTVPLGLSGGWSEGGRSTTMITPLYHRTTEGGATTSTHLLTWMRTPEMQAVAPLWWDWRTDAGGRRTILAPLWYQHRRRDGDFTATALPLLASYHRGAELDTSFSYQLFPFLVQSAPEGSEINVLWRLFHQRTWKGSSETMLWPLWWSESRAGEPLSWQVLGGLLGRDCDRTSRTSLSYAAWGALRFGGRTSYPEH